MYIPSDKYTIASKKLTRNPKSKIVVDGVEYTGMDIIKIHPVISHEATKMIGDFPTKSCKFTLFNRNNEINFVGKDINVYRGLVLDDDTVEYIPQGIFNVKTDDVKSSSTAKTIEFSVKDKSIIFDDLYGGEENVLYPTTVKIFIEEMCNRRGITLETQTFPFSDLILQQRPNFDLNSTTERWLIAKAAELGGCNAQISRTGGLVISKPLIVNQTIKRIDYKSLASKENVFGPINYVALSNANYTNDIVSKDDASITEHGKTEWKLLDNPYVDLIRESIVDSIANELFGMTIIPFELNDTIDSYLYDINDRITIQDKSGNFFDTTILSVNSTSRIFTNLKANVQENSQTDHMLAGSSKNDIKQVKLDVDHVKNNITAIATEVSDQNEKITKVELDVDSISQTVSNSLNFEKEVIGKTQVYIEDALPTKIKQFELRGYSRPQLSTYPGLNYPGISYPSGLVENKIDHLIITVDKQPKSNPSSSKKPYVLNIGEPLRSLNNIYDKLTIDIDSKVTITRRLKIENDKIVQLSNPIVTTIEDCNIILFEGDNYIYVNDPNYQMQVDYLFNNELNKQFATKTELTTSIQQTDSTIQLLAEKKVDDDKIIATINLTTQTDDGGSEIKLKADKLGLEGCTTINGAFSVDLSGNMKANGATMNDVLITGGDITLEDTGDDSNPTIEIYDKNSVTLGTLNVGDNLNDKILNMNFLTNGDIMGSSQPSLQWNNLITTDKWNYIQHFYTSTNNTEEFLCINYKGKTNYLYINYGRNIETNLTTYQLPSDFGKITSIGSINGIYNYIKIGSIRKKTTKLKSSGVEIIDVDNNVNTIYGSNGMYVKDQYGTKSFGANGILYMTSYGPDYSQFSVDNRTLMYVARGLKSHMLMDCGYPNPNDDYFEIQLNQTRQLLLNSNGLTCVTLTQTSLESMKKNIKKFTNALELVKNSDIYTYNFKHEDDEDKKHIGLVIGENYNTPNELVSKSGEGIDTYSMISVLWKAVQEQQTIIEKLGDRIKKLEEMIE